MSSYEGHSFGDLRQELEERIPRLVGEYYPGGNCPFVIRWPEKAIPSHLCIGTFFSDALGLDEVEGYSRLVICWFVWHVDRHIRDIVDPGLEGLAWTEHAQDASFW